MSPRPRSTQPWPRASTCSSRPASTTSTAGIRRPNQAAIQDGNVKGYAAYKVDDAVTTHEAWGLGSYCYYIADPDIRQDHGFAAPNAPGVRFHDLLVVSLGGKDQYEHVVNTTGAATTGTSTTPSTVVSYP
ncbi:hypothetical protein GCM10010211_74150 [Streptomyces albospinus]|uniref:Uncharacterized protein n=1 Tax=Streptomyces albospinus TaxID=285515 RepID=A0ABQ2VL81_9ACTN|nr:hypothetical protein GCM10010211_74150 [Streptomyces albospinus]